MIEAKNSIPRVSVFIPNYNYARYLPQCLDSILAQTYQDFEIVIVDDGSTDNSLEVLTDYQARYPEKIHYYWHPGHANKGVTATSNLAITKSGGEYLAWTGSDDVWYPDKLGLQVEQLDHNPQLGMVYSYADFINGEGKLMPGRAGHDITTDPNPVGKILQYCYPPAMTTIIRRQCFHDVGLVDESLRACEDWDLWIRIFSRWKVGFIDRSLAQYRIHGTNMSKRIEPKTDLNRILIFYQNLERKKNIIGDSPFDKRNRAILDLQLAFHLFSANKDDDAILHLHSAFTKDVNLWEDIPFFNNWLNQWKPDFYTLDHNHFGFWAISHLPSNVPTTYRARLLDLQLKNPETKAFFVKRGIRLGQSKIEPCNIIDIFNDVPTIFQIPQSWKTDVLKEIYPALLFDSYRVGQRAKTRYFWSKTVQLDSSWLISRGILSIGMKAFITWR